jgi:nicotinamide mononucleotide adenylyltransferase
MSQTITPKDIFESAKKHGNDGIFEWTPEDFKPKVIKKGAYDCNWIPIAFKPAVGTTTIKWFKLKFMKVVTASGAKLPRFNDGEPKNMFIAFRKMSVEDFDFGDFVPKSMNNEEDQIIENERVKKLVDEYLTATNEFNDALEIIDNSYHRICGEIKKAKSLGYSIRKDKKVKHNKDVPENSIRQSFREDKENLKTDPDAAPIKLEFPLSRLKLSLDKKNGKVGISIWNNSTKCFEFKPNVYNARKMTKKNNYTPVLATVKTDGKVEALDKKNASTFITFKSIIGGEWDFKDICCSKNGFSLDNKFLDLYVTRNKNVVSTETFSTEERRDMAAIDENENEDSESDVEIVSDLKDIKISKDIDEIDEIEDDDSDLEAPNEELDAEENSDLEDGAEED